MPVARRWNLRTVGPAILLTATSVGAGDILTGTLAGAEAGTAILWAVPAGVLLKWTLTEGIARWQLGSGVTLLAGCVTHFGRPVRWIFFPYLLLFALVTGAMLASACGVAATGILPLGDRQQSRLLYAALHSLAGLALVWFGGYALLKRLLAVCVGAMVATILLTAFLLSPDWTAVATGLLPSVPPAGARWIIGLIGAIGGTMALISYGYWIAEEDRSGAKGLAACRFDLLLSYAVIGIFGVAVVIIGSRIQVRGQGVELALLMAAQLERSLGPAGHWIFLIGFWAAVFSALLGVWQSLPYLYADLRRLSGHTVSEPLGRSRDYRLFLTALSTIPLVLVRYPVKELQLAFGLTGACLLPLLAASLLILNNRTAWVTPAFRATPLLNGILAAALLLFAWLGFTEIRQLLQR